MVRRTAATRGVGSWIGAAGEEEAELEGPQDYGRARRDPEHVKAGLRHPGLDFGVGPLELKLGQQVSRWRASGEAPARRSNWPLVIDEGEEAAADQGR